MPKSRYLRSAAKKIDLQRVKGKSEEKKGTSVRTSASDQYEKQEGTTKGREKQSRSAKIKNRKTRYHAPEKEEEKEMRKP